MRAALVIIGLLAAVTSASVAAIAAPEALEKMTRYKVVGYVGDFNSKYVLLKARKKFRIVPRHAVENADAIRPGRLAIARLTVKDLASVRKFQKSRILPR